MMWKKCLALVCCLVCSCIFSGCASYAAPGAVTFGNPINYGNVPSVVRDVFPIGTTVVPGAFPSSKMRWRWFDLRRIGRLQALLTYQKGEQIWPELKFPIDLKGVYTVQFLIPHVTPIGIEKLGPIALNVKLANDKEFDLLSAPETPGAEEWITWKKVDLTDQTIVLARPDGCSSALKGIRFVPEDGGKTITWQETEFVDNIRRTNDIYEDQNPADVAAFVAPIFKQLKDMHMNTVVVRNLSSPAIQLAILNEAQRNGLKVMLTEIPIYLSIKKQVDALLADDAQNHPQPEAAAQLIEKTFSPIINKLKDHPALLAYVVHDEPFVEEAPGYRLLYETLRKLDPQHPATGYLCRASWNSDATSSRGIDNMKKIVDAVDAQVLFNDLYPIRIPAEDSAKFIDRYVESLNDDVRQAGGRPLWIVAQAIRYKQELRDPTPAEIRVQAYLSIAYGATGIIYYNYNGPDSTLPDEFGNATPSLLEMGRVAEDLSRLAPVLLTLQRVQISGAFPHYLDVQGFQNKEGGHYLMAVNKDVMASHTAKLTLPVGIHRVIDMRSGDALVVQQNSIQLNLAAGDGVLLKLK